MPLTQIIERTVKSPSAERLHLTWRSDSMGTKNARLADLVANILTNQGDCGLIDLNINQSQKALRAMAYSSAFKNYGTFSLIIVPQHNQTLDEAKQLLLDQIELVKNGDFPDWLISAITNDMKIQRMKAFETADGLATTLYGTYINDISWEEELNEIELYAQTTKEEIVEFANEFFRDNYVVLKKEKGINEKLVHVDNPGITPIKLNREEQSEFLKDLLSVKSAEIEPHFINYKTSIITDEIGDKKISFVKNKYNDIAQVHFIFPFGSDHDKKLGLATQVLQYLGTNKMSGEELKQEFFKLGISNNFHTSKDQLRLSLSGLEENMAEGLRLLKDWMKHAEPDQGIYEKNVETILEGREVAKKDKGRIMAALSNYAKYGKLSRFSDVISEKELKAINSEEMTEKIKDLLQMPYEIFFYGQNFINIKNELKSFIEPAVRPVPERKIYPEPATSDKVYFVDYDMVQVEMGRVAKGAMVNINNFGKINVFNEYFGRGLSSIVFQEIRESKSLAYSAFVSYSAGAELEHPDYITTYIGTQADKLSLAVSAMDELMAELPQFSTQFETAKNSALKQIAAGRINRTNVYFNYLNLKKLKIDYDLRIDMYKEIKNLTLEDLTEFYDTQLKPVAYNTAIMGKKENLDINSLKELGIFQEVTLEEIFGY